MSEDKLPRVQDGAEYAFQATLFVCASDPVMAEELAARVARSLSEPYQWDLEDEHGDPEPVDVTLRLESDPMEMVPGGDDDADR
jgi:hypothetical protein